MTDTCPTPGCEGLSRVVLADLRHPRLEDFTFAFRHCVMCGLGFVSPQPDSGGLHRLYENYTYHGLAAASTVRRYSRKLRAARWLRWQGPRLHDLPIHQRWIESLMGRSVSAALAMPAALPRNAHMVDYGFGSGTWLLAMRKLKFENLYGFDIQANSRTCADLEQRGIRVLGDVSFWPPATFDCVRLEHVVEHLPSPLATLTSIRRALRPGGVVVLTMPSIHAWEPVEELPRSAHLDHLQLPVHLFHFSTRSLRALMQAAGYEIVHLRIMEPHRFLSVAAIPSGLGGVTSI